MCIVAFPLTVLPARGPLAAVDAYRPNSSSDRTWRPRVGRWSQLVSHARPRPPESAMHRRRPHQAHSPQQRPMTEPAGETDGRWSQASPPLRSRVRDRAHPRMGRRTGSYSIEPTKCRDTKESVTRRSAPPVRKLAPTQIVALRALPGTGLSNPGRSRRGIRSGAPPVARA